MYGATILNLLRKDTDKTGWVSFYLLCVLYFRCMHCILIFSRPALKDFFFKFQKQLYFTMMTLVMCGTLSAYSMVKGYVPHQVKVVDLVSQPQLPLIMPSATLLPHTLCKTHSSHYIWYQSEFLLALQGENVHRGQPRDMERNTKCERGRKGESRKKWKRRRLGGK